MRRFVLGLLGLPIIFALLVATPALAFNQRITVYASVPLMRAIYVDDSGNLVKVAGNTAQNIDPTVYNLQNKPLQLTDSIKSQYELFLKQHNNHLEASKIYLINPIIVNTATNNQSITVADQPTRLSLSL